MLARIAKLLRIQPPVVEDEGLLFASGATVPTDAAAGYQTGCLFQHTDGAEGTAMYLNEGDEDSCDFNAVAALTATQEALIGATAGTVTASKAVIVDSSKNIAGFGTVGCGALTAASIVCTAGATFGGGAGATGLTIGTDGKLTIDGTIQVNDNVTLQMEGVAADLDGLTLACDNAGDAVLNITAGKLTLTTSDSSITTASVLTLTSATAGIVINAAEAIGISILTSTPTDGINIAAACANAIAISGANTTAAINISGTPPTAINIAPTWVAATSMTPIKIAYNYLGASTTGDTDAYGIRSTITSSNHPLIAASSVVASSWTSSIDIWVEPTSVLWIEQVTSTTARPSETSRATSASVS